MSADTAKTFCLLINALRGEKAGSFTRYQRATFIVLWAVHQARNTTRDSRRARRASLSFRQPHVLYIELPPVRPVNRYQTASVGVVCIALLILLASPGVIASQPSQGFAAYEVAVTLPSGPHSALVNESLLPSDRPGLSTLTLRVTGGDQNLTYSRLVNASADLLPYLTNLLAQSFDYSNGTGYSIQANFSSGGTTTATFRGTEYTLSVYSVTLQSSDGNGSVKAQGTVETFPSTLVYSVSASEEGKFQVQAVLQATDLSLVDPPPQTAMTSYVGAGIGVGGVALAAALLVRRKERKAGTQEQKPMHWVD